jgi:hypothetical protein
MQAEQRAARAESAGAGSSGAPQHDACGANGVVLRTIELESGRRVCWDGDGTNAVLRLRGSSRARHGAARRRDRTAKPPPTTNTSRRADFKAYRGHVAIGPLGPGLTAVVGPNGTGKSVVVRARAPERHAPHGGPAWRRGGAAPRRMRGAGRAARATWGTAPLCRPTAGPLPSPAGPAGSAPPHASRARASALAPCLSGRRDRVRAGRRQAHAARQGPRQPHQPRRRARGPRRQGPGGGALRCHGGRRCAGGARGRGRGRLRP